MPKFRGRRAGQRRGELCALSKGLAEKPVGESYRQARNYLCAILNAPVTTELARPFMSYGKDERDIHKAPWELPIPAFDEGNATHVRLSQLGVAAEQIAAAFPVNPELHFAATRRHIRQLIDYTPEGREIDELVYELVS